MKEEIIWKWGGEESVSANIIMTGLSGSPLYVYRVSYDGEMQHWVVQIGLDSVSSGWATLSEAERYCEDHWQARRTIQ